MAIDPTNPAGPPVPPEPVQPTQVAHPFKAALRTFLQTLITLLGLWPVLQNILEETALDLGWEQVLPAIGIASVVAAALSRIMAIPGVNELLTKIGVGARPASAAPKV